MFKNLILIIVSTLVVFFVACSDEVNKDKFLQIYRQILITRTKTIDSLEANKRVLEILKQNNYDEESFKREFYYLAKNENGFLKIIDSMRNSITIEYKHKLDSANRANRKNHPEYNE